MSTQNIIDLSFDISKFDGQKQHIYEELLKVYDLAKQMGSNSIPIGSAGGWSELTSKIEAQEKVISKLEASYAKLTSATNASRKANDDQAASTDKATAATKKKEQSEAQLEKVKQQRLKTDQEVVKLIREEDKAEQQNTRTKKEKLAFEQALLKEKAKGANQAGAEAKIAAQLTDEYAMLSKSLKEQEVRYKNLALVKGFEADATQEALKEALATRAVLDKLDTNLKNYGRNVGNYKSAFDGLGMSFSQVARELPSLTISTQQFMLAISNNLPMVFDEISKARQEISAMKAAGEETPSLFSRIAKSVFSLQVGLSLLVLAFTIFGPKIFEAIGKLFGFSDAAEKAAQATSQLQKAQLELIKTQEELNKLLADPINDLDRLSKTLIIYQALGKSRGDQLEIEKKILENQRLTSNQDFMKADENGLSGFALLEDLKIKFAVASTDYQNYVKALSETTDADAQKNIQKSLDRAKITLDLYKELYTRQKKVVEDNYNTTIELQAKNDEIVRYKTEQRLIIETEAAKAAAQLVIDNNERILADERNFEDERITALRSSAKKRKDIISADLRKVNEDPANKNLDGTYTAEAIVAQKKAAAEIDKIDKDLQVSIFNTHEEYRKRRLAAELAITQAEVSYASARYKEISTIDSNSFIERTEAYANYFRAEQELIKKDHDFQIETKVMTSQELLALEAATQKKLKELADKGRKEISDIYVSNENELLKMAESIDKNKLSKEELDLYKSLKNKTEFAKKAQQLELKQQREAIANDNLVQQEIIASNNTTVEAKKAAQQKLLDNQTRLNQLELTEEQRKQQAKASISEIYFNIEVKAVETFFSLYQKLADAQHQRRLDQLQEEAKVVENNYSAEIDNIKNSTLSQQEKAARITILDAQHAAKKEELARKEREEKIKQAKTDKAIGVAKIIVETALAVVHALTTGDPYTAYARAALSAATGAAELAAAIATPIPSYKEGTDNHPGGPARYGEDGPEAVKEPGKPWRIVTSETVGLLARGTKVKPLTSQDINDAAYGSMVHGMQERLAIAEYAESIRGNDKMLKEVRDAVLSTGHLTAQALRKQKGSSVTVNVNGYWGDKIQREVRG